MKEARNWIIGSATALFLVFGGKAALTGEDIPEGMRGLIMVVFGAGLGLEPAAAAAQKLLGRKKEEGAE